MRGTESSELFIKDFIPKVSRTFALTIQFLPRGLRDSVFVSYLLCRIADTLEDSPILTAAVKKERLERLSEILNRASAGREFAKSEIERLYSSIDADQGDDHRLLAESSRFFEILEKLPAVHRKIICRWAGEMAGGMAEFTKLYDHGKDEPGALDNADEWNRYCYYVAGTVGLMMTELFISHYDFTQKRADRLAELGNSFGLGLQKVNVIKDVSDDRNRGVCYLPRDKMSEHGLSPGTLGAASERQAESFIRALAENAIAHLDDAISYSILIPSAYKSVRMFLVVPVYLAAATLKLIVHNPRRCLAGPPLKLSRRDVTRLVGAAAGRIGSNGDLEDYYKKLVAAF